MFWTCTVFCTMAIPQHCLFHNTVQYEHSNLACIWSIYAHVFIIWNYTPFERGLRYNHKKKSGHCTKHHTYTIETKHTYTTTNLRTGIRSVDSPAAGTVDAGSHHNTGRGLLCHVDGQQWGRGIPSICSRFASYSRISQKLIG